MQIQYISSNELAQMDRPIVAEGALLAMPFTHTDLAQRAVQLMSSRAAAPGLILAIHDAKQEGFVSLINQVFAKSHSAYFAYVAQDAFAGRGWLKMALQALGDSKGLLGFNDGKWAGALAGFGIARRSWASANYNGSFFYPHYQRHYADAELTLLALQAGAYAYDPASLLVEVDWDKDGAAVNEGDRALFLERKKNGFDAMVSDVRLLNLIS
jgi:hypothetical protein